MYLNVIIAKKKKRCGVIMASPIKKARFGDQDLYYFKELQTWFHLDDTHGGESETLQRAVRLAYRYIELQERMSKLFGFPEPDFIRRI